MKNVINYFYNFNIDNIRMIDDNYYFVYMGKKFIFFEIKDKFFEHNAVMSLNALLANGDNNFYQIILNINNNVLTYSSNKKYILLLDNFEQDREFNYLDILDTNVVVKEINKNFNQLNRGNWATLWKTKLDYFEIFVEQNMNKYPILNDYYNYFIGLAENAISYFEDTTSEIKPSVYDKMVVSHKRIESNYTFKDLYNPVSLIIDHPSRDFAEYLKMMFFEQKNEDIQFFKYLNSVNLSNYGARMFFSRMLYPSFFFDAFEKIINDRVSINNILKIIGKMDEYQNYLFEIYTVLRNKYNIPKIEWLKKVDYSSTLTTPSTSGTSLISIDSIPSLSVTSIMLQ